MGRFPTEMLKYLACMSRKVLRENMHTCGANDSGEKPAL
jgi:hypothetical protein